MNTLEATSALDVVLRLAAATLAGSLLGLNRELRRKPAGLRTHALVSLGAALLVVTFIDRDGVGADAVSRVVQGIITGIGFLGAGVILHRPAGRVTGLTSAAMIWIAAALGVVAGLGRWLELIAGLALIAIVLFLERVEQWLGRHEGADGADSNGAA